MLERINTSGKGQYYYLCDAKGNICLLYTSLEQIVGLQTDKPLKRAFMPYGGIKMAVHAAETYGYNVSDKLKEIFTKYHKTHNTAVFDAYTPEMMKVRHAKILTGLPDKMCIRDSIGSATPENDIVEIRGIKIDKTARRVWVNGEEKQFTRCV